MVIISIIVCGVLYGLLSLWASYDPKESAISTARRCLEQQPGSCGRITATPCLAALYQSASQPDNEYQINVFLYNGEDVVCCRGGDEVSLQVDFTNGDSYRLLWYEGFLEECTVLTP